MKTEDQRYIQAVIAAYIALPDTPDSASRSDRQLAAQLHARGVPFPVVNVALLLGAARRLGRTLPPVRSLHYFLPIIEEVQHNPPSPSYIRYLEMKIRQLTQPTAGAR